MELALLEALRFNLQCGLKNILRTIQIFEHYYRRGEAKMIIIKLSGERRMSFKKFEQFYGNDS